MPKLLCDTYILYLLPQGLKEATCSTVCHRNGGPDPGQIAVWRRGRCQHSGAGSRLLCGTSVNKSKRQYIIKMATVQLQYVNKMPYTSLKKQINSYAFLGSQKYWKSKKNWLYFMNSWIVTSVHIICWLCFLHTF